MTFSALPHTAPSPVQREVTALKWDKGQVAEWLEKNGLNELVVYIFCLIIILNETYMLKDMN